MTDVPRVIMLVTNDVSRDSRVKKEAKSLTQAGWDVQIFGLSPRVNEPEPPSLDGLNVTLIPASVTSLIAGRLETAAVKQNRATATATATVTADTVETRRITIPKLLVFGYSVFRKFLGARLHRLLLARQFRKQLLTNQEVSSANVLHCHDFDTLIAGYKIAKRSGALLVYDSHELWSEMNVSGANIGVSQAIRAIQRLQEKRLMKKCVGIITVSHSIASVLSEKSSEKMVAPIIVRNIPAKRSPPEAEGLRSVEHNKIFYSGRITSGRALPELIRSLDHESMSTFGIRLLGYGSPPFLQEIVSMAREREVELEVVAPVPGPLVPERLGGAEVVFVGVSPIVLSYRFSLPNKLFEALHSGRPVVVPRLPDIEQTVGGLEAVYFCDPTDSNSIRDALLQACKTPVNTRRLRAERLELFSWEQEESKLIQMYDGFRSGKFPGGLPFGKTPSNSLTVLPGRISAQPAS